MPVSTYRIKIVREGFEFEAEGDKVFVLKMVDRFEPNAANGTKSSTADAPKSKDRSKRETSATGALPTSKSISIREFVQSLDFAKHTDITLAFGYYLEKHVGVPAFTPADINNCYYEAKLDSSNTSQMITRNIKRGMMMASKKSDEKKTLYTLTQSGEAFITSHLPANG